MGEAMKKVCKAAGIEKLRTFHHHPDSAEFFEKTGWQRIGREYIKST